LFEGFIKGDIFNRKAAACETHCRLCWYKGSSVSFCSTIEILTVGPVDVVYVFHVCFRKVFVYDLVITAHCTLRRVRECMVLYFVKFLPKRKTHLRKPADLVDVCVALHHPIFPAWSLKL
jgi:hypothetical protein